MRIYSDQGAGFQVRATGAQRANYQSADGHRQNVLRANLDDARLASFSVR